MKEALRVLVVDDEMSIRGVVSSVLSDDGHQVTVAQSGEEALEFFAKGPFALVISDIVMPGISGIELLKKIKELSVDTQVIIMTSHASLNTAIEALRAGAYDYLIKPFDDINVISIVTQRAVDKINLVKENRALLENLKQKNVELARINEVLQTLAVQDGLTGLYNHRYFQETLAVEVERSKRYQHAFALLFMDVDHFKKFNDTNGHLAGDIVLHDLAALLKKSTRKSNIVARYGGEEFVVILPETTREQALICAEKLRGLIADYSFQGKESQPLGKVTVSIGVAAYPADGAEPGTLIDCADQALYRAKKSGRNRVC